MSKKKTSWIDTQCDYIVGLMIDQNKIHQFW